jgi:hypothetical protein
MKKERTPHTHTRHGDILAALIVLFLISTLFVACTADVQQEGIRNESGMPITFSAVTDIDSPATATDSRVTTIDTRATGDVSDIAALKLTSGFGVFASYTGAWRYTTTTVSPDFLCNQQVEWSAVPPQTGTWTYSPLKYWPNGEGNSLGEGQIETEHHVSFFAYAPWSDLTTPNSPADCITDCSQTYEQGDPWVLYRIAGSEGGDPTSKQVDLLYAACDYYHYGLGDGLCNIDLTKPEVAGRVRFNFRHALGTVGDEVTVSAATELQTALKALVSGSVTEVSLILKSITIDYTLTSKARLVLYARDGTPNWKNVTSENVKTTRTVSTTISHTLYHYDGTTATATDFEEWNGKGVFYIPIEGDDYVQRARITVGYQVVLTGGTPYPATGSATITKNVVLHEQTGYGAGKRLDFDITLGGTIPISE